MIEKENMTMSDQMQDGMAEAMRLMQKGDLTEATAVIQRTLGGSSFGSGFQPVASPDAPSGAGAPIDVESTVVDEARTLGRLVGLPQVVGRPQPRALPRRPCSS